MKIIDDKIKNLIFFVEGGIGKNLAATAVVRAIKKQYPDKDIIVMAGCPDVFMYNPNVKRTYNFGNPMYFYEDHINDSSFILKEEPYLHYDYINKNKHVVECWCEMLGVKFDGIEPDLYFIPNEITAAEIYKEEITSKGSKGLALIQWVGGGIPETGEEKSIKEKLSQMYRRALPQKTTQEVVDYLVKKNYEVGIIGHPNFPNIKDTRQIFFKIRATLALLNVCDLFIGIDSFAQHACASKQINKKGIVIWGGTSPKVLGYDSNINLTQEVCNTPYCHRPNSYLFDINQQGTMWDCPFGESCLQYKTSVIIDTMKPYIKEYKGVKKTSKPTEEKCSGCK